MKSTMLKSAFTFLSVFCLGAPLCVPASAAGRKARETVVWGSLLDQDGNPLRVAHVHLTRPQHDKPDVSVEPDRRGRFRLSADETGAFFIRFTGINHMSAAIPFVAGTPQTLQVDVRLASYEYVDDFSDVKVVGDFNDFSPKTARPMEKQPDGSWSVELETAKPRIAYQLMGFEKSGRWVNGPQADTFEYDGDGDYRSVVAAKDGKVRITLRPLEVKRSSKPGETRFGKPASPAARLAAAYDDMNRRDTASRNGGAAPAEHGKESDSLAVLSDRMEREKDPLVRQMLALSILSTEFYGSKLEPRLAHRALENLPPSSRVWTLNPWVLSSAFAHLRESRVSGGSEYAWHVAEAQKDPTVRPIVLAAAFKGARDAGDSAVARRFYDRLLAEFPDDPETKHAKDSGLGGEIAVGKRIPSFTLPSLNDSNVSLTADTLKGKVTLIDFWATWCLPCVGEMGSLHRAYERYASRAFQILSVSIDEKPEVVASFRKDKWKLPWMNAWAGGEFKSDALKRFEIFWIPRQILVDRDGTILATDLHGTDLQKTLDRVLTAP